MCKNIWQFQNNALPLSTIKCIVMARPIRETPILTGEDAIRFDEEMKRVESMSSNERLQNRLELEHACSSFINNLTVSI